MQPMPGFFDETWDLYRLNCLPLGFPHAFRSNLILQIEAFIVSPFREYIERTCRSTLSRVSVPQFEVNAYADAFFATPSDQSRSHGAPRLTEVSGMIKSFDFDLIKFTPAIPF